MAFAETANLAVKLTLGGNFTSQLAKSRAALRGFDKDASRAYKAGTQIGTGIKRGATIAAAGVGVLVSQIGFGLDQLIELEALNAQTVAGLKSTSAASGQTAESIRKLAEKYESLNATVDDKVIQSGENLLLTFTAVRKEAFEPALVAALDMSKALGKPLESSILAIGKALQDPVKGVTALGRAGVDVRALKPRITSVMKLTKEEAKRLAVLERTDKKAAKKYAADLRTNKILQAQKLILAELNVEFGGRFAAGAGTVEERVAAFGDAIEDVQKNLASAFLPVVSNVATELQKLLQDPATTRAITDLSNDLAKLFSPENIQKGIGLLKDGFNALKSIAGPIADVLRTAVGAFTSLPPDIQKLLVGGFVANKLTGGLVTNIAGGIFGALKAMTVQAAVVNVTGGIVNGAGGIPGGGKGGNPLGTAAKVGGLAAAAAIGTSVIISGVTVAAAGALANAIDPSAVAPGRETLGNRDPRRFNSAGQVVQNSIPILKTIATNTALISDKDSQANARQQAASEKVRTAVETMRGDLFGKLAASVSATEASKSAIVAATRQVGPSLASAMRPPSVYTDVKVYVTAAGVTKSVTQQTRYGPGNGSSGSTANSMVGGTR